VNPAVGAIRTADDDGTVYRWYGRRTNICVAVLAIHRDPSIGAGCRQNEKGPPMTCGSVMGGPTGLSGRERVQRTDTGQVADRGCVPSVRQKGPSRSGGRQLLSPAAMRDAAKDDQSEEGKFAGWRASKIRSKSWVASPAVNRPLRTFGQVEI
jgi:hypothetical protein